MVIDGFGYEDIIPMIGGCLEKQMDKLDV